MSSLLQSLSALIQGRQHDRILRLSFPHDDGPQAQLLVNKLDAVESLSRDFAFTVELLSDDAGLALKDLQGKLFTVELVRADGSLRYFSGYCFEFRLIRTDGSISFYQARLGPWLQYLHLRKDNFIFHGKTLREQLDSIFSDYGTLPDWDFRVSGEDPAMTDAFQFNESDSNYVHRRLEAAGLLYYYEHSAQGHKLVITDDSTQAAAIDGGPEIRFQRHGGAIEEDGIGEFSPVRQIVPGSVSLSGFNFKSPVPINAGVPTLNKQGNVLDIESYEYVGAYGVKNAQDADKLSRLRMEEIEAAGKHFEAAGNNRSVLPGRWYQLTGHFAFNPFGSHEEAGKNEFLILSVHHVASNNYLQQADQKADYSNRLTCIRKSIPWRPGRGFNSVATKILSPQTVTVVGPSGQGSIHTDEYGRIRVQFHWDRIGNNDEKSSAWVRVASSWAGGELGAKSIPRVGSECVVQWLDGNPDRPIVTGSVYNQRNMPPWKLATQQPLMGFRSRELTPNGGNQPGGRSNHLILDDSNGKIQAQLKSDHQHSQLSLGHITRIEDNAGRKDARGEGWELRTDGHGVVRSAKGMLITTEARGNAASHIKDMGETVQRLTSARDQHETLADMARQAGAQEKQGQQVDIAKILKAQNDAIKGSGAGGDGNFPELSSPHLVLASPAGIESTTSGSTHIASGQNTAITTGKSLSIASGDSLFASIRQTFRLFVYKAGMKMIAAGGDIDVQALTNGINILAKLNITHTANRITIVAKEEVMINGGGSYVKYNAAGIEHGTNGIYVAHAATHSLPGPANLSTPKLPVPVKMPEQMVFNLHTLAGQSHSIPEPYELYRDGALVEHGVTDEWGRIVVKDHIPTSKYEVKLSEGSSLALPVNPENKEEPQRISNLGFRDLGDASDGLTSQV
ncbi:type VI secretion system Vgr family protein [Collimonas fungivorans]|uniref:Rhs element Vgr protein n=1 Tax=Collimonas fungivorans (strain Ter331) TaxID=1005048 RepID=G0A7V2_COLFT|nr:type VI secretion system Vgr family protein [Collimonas fungivorans]AEK59863.1 Rhs element Vgr protein [Collimonas fungivorans Ter331]